MARHVPTESPAARAGSAACSSVRQRPKLIPVPARNALASVRSLAPIWLPHSASVRLSAGSAVSASATWRARSSPGHAYLDRRQLDRLELVNEDRLRVRGAGGKQHLRGRRKAVITARVDRISVGPRRLLRRLLRLIACTVTEPLFEQLDESINYDGV